MAPPRRVVGESPARRGAASRLPPLGLSELGPGQLRRGVERKAASSEARERRARAGGDRRRRQALAGCQDCAARALQRASLAMAITTPTGAICPPLVSRSPCGPRIGAAGRAMPTPRRSHHGLRAGRSRSTKTNRKHIRSKLLRRCRACPRVRRTYPRARSGNQDHRLSGAAGLFPQAVRARAGGWSATPATSSTLSGTMGINDAFRDAELVTSCGRRCAAQRDAPTKPRCAVTRDPRHARFRSMSSPTVRAATAAAARTAAAPRCDERKPRRDGRVLPRAGYHASPAPNFSRPRTSRKSDRRPKRRWLTDSAGGTMRRPEVPPFRLTPGTDAVRTPSAAWHATRRCGSA